MKPRAPKPWLLALAFLAALGPLSVEGDDPEVQLDVSVNAEEGGVAIANASVYVKYKETRWLRKDKKREYRGKTNAEGRTGFTALPEGAVLVQVVAEGWKTYGEYHKLHSPKQSLAVKLKKPRKWY